MPLIWGRLMVGQWEATQPGEGPQQAVTVPHASAPPRRFAAGAQGEGSSLLPPFAEGGTPSHGANRLDGKARDVTLSSTAI